MNTTPHEMLPMAGSGQCWSSSAARDCELCGPLLSLRREEDSRSVECIAMLTADMLNLGLSTQRVRVAKHASTPIENLPHQ